MENVKKLPTASIRASDCRPPGIDFICSNLYKNAEELQSISSANQVSLFELTDLHDDGGLSLFPKMEKCFGFAFYKSKYLSAGCSEMNKLSGRALHRGWTLLSQHDQLNLRYGVFMLCMPAPSFILARMLPAPIPWRILPGAI
jgi:hypothetical protein